MLRFARKGTHPGGEIIMFLIFYEFSDLSPVFNNFWDTSPFFEHEFLG
jgi:hypothetical protein